MSLITLKEERRRAAGFHSCTQRKGSMRPTSDWSMWTSFTSAATHDIRRRSSNSSATQAPLWSGRKSLVIMQNSRREKSNFSMQMVKFPTRTSVQRLLMEALTMSGSGRYGATRHVGHGWKWSSQMPEVSSPGEKKHKCGRREAAVIRKGPRSRNKQLGFQPNNFPHITSGMSEAPELHDGLQIMFEGASICSL